MCVQFVQVTQIKLKVPRVWEKSLLRMYVWKTPLLIILSILIQFKLHPFPAITFILSITFNAIYCFLYICQVSFPELSTRTLLVISLRFQNKPFLDYEHDRKIHDFFKQNTKSLSTCPRINLIDPVSHQSQIWKISGCLPIFTVNSMVKPNEETILSNQ